MVATPHEDSPLLGERGQGHYGSSDTLVNMHDSDDSWMGNNDKHTQPMPRWKAALIFLSLGGLIFLQASNMSGITTTQSYIAEDLDAFAEASWFTSVYLIATSSTSPIYARMAQIFSPRSCVLVGSFIFAIGAIIVSQATDLRYFLIGRAIQGVGSGGIMTTSFILILELAEQKRRGLYIGLINTTFAVGVTFGAIIAGLLVGAMGWRFLFQIQVPLALLFGTGIFFSVPELNKDKDVTLENEGTLTIWTKISQIDFLGALTLCLSTSLLLFGLSQPTIIWSTIVASVVILTIFILVELYVVTDPIIPVTVLKSRGALLSCLAQLGVMAARWTILFFTPVYAIAVLAWSPSAAGSILIPSNFGFAFGGVLVGIYHIKRGGSFWLPSVVSTFLFALALSAISQLTSGSTSTPVICLAVFLSGLFIGAVLNYTLAHLLHLTPTSTHYISSSLLTTVRGFAASFGSAIGSGLFVRTLKAELEEGFREKGGLEGREELVRKLLGSPALVKTLEGVERKIAVHGYETGLRTIFMAAAGLALMMVVVQALTGWEDGDEQGKEDERTLDGEELWEEGV